MFELFTIMKEESNVKILFKENMTSTALCHINNNMNAYIVEPLIPATDM